MRPVTSELEAAFIPVSVWRGDRSGSSQGLSAGLQNAILADRVMVHEVHVVENDRADDRDDQCHNDQRRKAALHITALGMPSQVGKISQLRS